ncbi:MAG: HD domain-containing phosphohydrolase [Candidatus Zixiibacteriota bacterium]
MRNDKHTTILVVDDEQHICDIIVEALAAEDHQIVALTEPHRALDYIADNPVDLVLTDLVMGDFSGERIVDATLGTHPDAIAILMTAHPTIQTAISVLKKGAFDFLIKPFKLDFLRATVRRGLQHQRLKRENLSLKGQLSFLKVAGAFQTGVEIDGYLRLVVASCKEEMSASAVGLIEINPESLEVVRKAGDSDYPEWIEKVMDESTVQHLLHKGSDAPVISTNVGKEDDKRILTTFICHPILIRRQLHGVINVLIRSRFDRLTSGQLDILTILCNAAASAIANHRLYRDLRASYMQAIRGLANAIEARDTCTRGHTERVLKLAELLAEKLGWTPKQVDHLVMGCSLHDIGKIGVPDSVLNKAGRLTEQEQQLMYDHPILGLKIIEGIDLFKPAIPYIVAHHERWDGSGYPRGLKGEGIPIEGRLLAVVDAFDAIMANRPYRPGADLTTAVAELMTHRGAQFDPTLVDAFIEVLLEEQIDLKRMYGRDENIQAVRELISQRAPA